MEDISCVIPRVSVRCAEPPYVNGTFTVSGADEVGVWLDGGDVCIALLYREYTGYSGMFTPQYVHAAQSSSGC